MCPWTVVLGLTQACGLAVCCGLPYKLPLATICQLATIGQPAVGLSRPPKIDRAEAAPRKPREASQHAWFCEALRDVVRKPQQVLLFFEVDAAGGRGETQQTTKRANSFNDLYHDVSFWV